MSTHRPARGGRRKHSLEVCEGGVGLERLCKGLRSLSTKAVVPETARGAGEHTQASEGWEEETLT